MYKTYSFSEPLLTQKVYTSTFFKLIVCRENDKKKKRWAKMLKVYRINIFFH